MRMYLGLDKAKDKRQKFEDGENAKNRKKKEEVEERDQKTKERQENDKKRHQIQTEIDKKEKLLSMLKESYKLILDEIWDSKEEAKKEEYDPVQLHNASPEWLLQKIYQEREQKEIRLAEMQEEL